MLKKKIIIAGLIIVLLLGALFYMQSKNTKTISLYIGTYTNKPQQQAYGESEGIYALRWNLTNGKLSPPVLVAKTANPTFVRLHPNKQYLYAVNEDDKIGEVKSYSIHPNTHGLSHINTQLSHGADPAHIEFDINTEHLIVSNYSGGSISLYPIEGDGSIGETSMFVQHRGSSIDERQKSPHPHSANLDPMGNYFIVADLGLDKLISYELVVQDGMATLVQDDIVTIASGAGPRHMVFLEQTLFAYVVNELDSTINMFGYDDEYGQLHVAQTISTLPKDGYQGDNLPAEIKVHPSEKFLYVSNRGHDSISVYSIEEDTGKLTFQSNHPTMGEFPRNFTLDPEGQYLLVANQHSNNLVLFNINQQTGALSFAGEQVHVNSPTYLAY